MIVLTVVLSCLNSGLYVVSRMNFALARRGDAPQWMVRLDGRGVPARAILIASSIGFLPVSMAFVDDVRSQLLLGPVSVAVVAVAFLIKNARGDSGEGDLPVGNGRFTAREDRERDPAAATFE